MAEGISYCLNSSSKASVFSCSKEMVAKDWVIRVAMLYKDRVL